MSAVAKSRKLQEEESSNGSPRTAAGSIVAGGVIDTGETITINVKPVEMFGSWVAILPISKAVSSKLWTPDSSESSPNGIVVGVVPNTANDISAADVAVGDYVLFQPRAVVTQLQTTTYGETKLVILDKKNVICRLVDNTIKLNLVR